MRISDWSADLCSSDLYADVLGIPFDFTAKPVVAPPQPPRETIHVKAVRPDRDHLAIRFPRVQGYRVAFQDEQITAEFNADSVDRTTFVSGQRVSVLLDLGGLRII